MDVGKMAWGSKRKQGSEGNGPGVLPAKGPAGLGGCGASGEVRVAVVGTHFPSICQRLGGHRAVRQRHQITGRLRFGNLERGRYGLKGTK